MEQLLPRLAAALASMLSAAAVSAQTIQIDSVPAYGTLGFVDGSVSGVTFTSHHVATFIYIEGVGWWTKPTLLTPTVPIDGSGNFTVNVGTGGPASLDSRAVIFCVALLPVGVAPATVEEAVRMPASLAPLALDCEERYGRTISFAGYRWAVKEAPAPVGPGWNVFSDRTADVFVDEAGLHLRVAFHDGQWWSSEVILLDRPGYSIYWVQTDSELDVLDANVTFAVFSWDPYGDDTGTPGWANRELDFEDSRWTVPTDPTNTQMVVQPHTAVPFNLRRYTIPDLSVDAALTRAFTWVPGAVEFLALRGHHPPGSFAPGDVIDRYLYLHDPPAGRYVPEPGRASLRINLWLNNQLITGLPPPQPAGGSDVEVIITNVMVPEPSAGLLRAAGLAALALLARRRRRSS